MPWPSQGLEKGLGFKKTFKKLLEGTRIRKAFRTWSRPSLKSKKLYLEKAFKKPFWRPLKDLWKALERLQTAFWQPLKVLKGPSKYIEKGIWRMYALKRRLKGLVQCIERLSKCHLNGLQKTSWSFFKWIEKVFERLFLGGLRRHSTSYDFLNPPSLGH